MKRLLHGVWMMLALVCLVGQAAAAGKNNGPFIAMHPEGSEDEGARMVRPDTVGSQTRWFRISPEVSGRHFQAYAPFASEDGVSFGTVLYLNEEGQRAAQVLCSTFQGKLVRIIVNGRPVDTVRIDRAPRDGKIIVWGGLTTKDFEAFDKSKKMKRLGALAAE